MPNGTQTYSITGMRVLFPTEKVAAANPDRFVTVAGEAFRTVDEKGKVSADPLSITSKVITKDQAANPLTVIDTAKGLLTIPEGRRGRTANEGADQDSLNAALSALRSGSASE